MINAADNTSSEYIPILDKDEQNYVYSVQTFLIQPNSTELTCLIVIVVLYAHTGNVEYLKEVGGVLENGGGHSHKTVNSRTAPPQSKKTPNFELYFGTPNLWVPLYCWGVVL